LLSPPLTLRLTPVVLLLALLLLRLTLRAHITNRLATI
jgi:hypothetical protein